MLEDRSVGRPEAPAMDDLDATETPASCFREKRLQCLLRFPENEAMKIDAVLDCKSALVKLPDDLTAIQRIDPFDIFLGI